MTKHALATVCALTLICGCLGGATTTEKHTKDNGTTPSDGLQKANPASKYCMDQGGTVKIVEEDGGQRGICEIDGVECDEWKYMRGECPGTEDGTSG
jgi:putative hemolysin